MATWKDVRETLEELKQAVEEMRKTSKALLEEVSKPWIVRYKVPKESMTLIRDLTLHIKGVKVNGGWQNDCERTKGKTRKCSRRC